MGSEKFQQRFGVLKKEFLNACPENARIFFELLFSESVRNGCTVSWGQKGSSIRAQTLDGRLATYFYGHPTGVNSSPTPLFQAYLGNIKEPSLHDAAHENFLKYCPFILKGNHTFGAGAQR